MDDRVNPLYQLVLDNRKKLSANGVTEVDSFDEKQVIAVSKLGTLVVKGEGIHITQLNLEEGKLTLEGVISDIHYLENNQTKTRAKGVMARLFK
ncbi:MAG: sporulation protein YabP [Clostridia bacterium]|nr:sporulation protein YabP [Clostridia bacterium]MDD4047981.1 sporulation protein YabP [Clostridia bacterium]